MPASDLSDSLLIYQALRLILHMKLYWQLPWTSLHPYQWLRSQITDIQVTDYIAFSQFAYDNDNNNRPTVFLRPVSENDLYTLKAPTQFMVEGSPGLRIAVGILCTAQLIMHEARHAVLPHDCDYECIKNTEGVEVCTNVGDSNLAYLGPWGVEYYLLSMVAQGQIDVGIRNSVNAGDYILGIISDLVSRAQTRFCTPPTATSLSVSYSPSTLVLGKSPPEHGTAGADITPKVADRNIILFYSRESTAPTRWTAVFLVWGWPMEHPFSSGYTNSEGHMEVWVGPLAPSWPPSWSLNEEGTYCLTAVFPGDSDYSPALADSSCGLTVKDAKGYSQLWDLSVNPTSASIVPGGSSNFNVQITGTSGGEEIHLFFAIYVTGDLVGFAVTFSPYSQPAPFNSIMTVTVDPSKSWGTYDLPFCAGITATPGTCSGSDIKTGHVQITVEGPVPSIGTNMPPVVGVALLVAIVGLFALSIRRLRKKRQFRPISSSQV